MDRKELEKVEEIEDTLGYPVRSDSEDSCPSISDFFEQKGEEDRLQILGQIQTCRTREQESL